jgi:hypothetical protein
VQRITLHADGLPEHPLPFPQHAHTHVTAIRSVPDRLDELRLRQLVDQKRDARLGAVQFACECALHGPVRTTGGNHEEQVISLLGQTEPGQGLAHDRLRFGEGAAQLGDELDVGQRVSRQQHTLGGHAVNVHARRPG